jgi:uncharacterized protein (DUF1330 family)
MALGLMLLACSSPQTTVSVDGSNIAAAVTSKNQAPMFAVALIYLHEGQEAIFQEYTKQVVPLATKYGLVLDRAIVPLKLAAGDMELPDQIRIIRMDNPDGFERLSEDPAYQQLIKSHRDKALSKLVFLPCQPSDFEFTREVGDATKTFGMAFLNYADGKKAQFDDYHEKACEIIPEFGAHFERFLVPVGVQGDFTQPDEVHLFFFDTPEGMQQMGGDPRMQNLFPQRDEALSSLNFLIGKATI